MAKITWKGEDELHGPDRGGPSYTIWNNIKFAKDKAVDVNDPRMIAKARANHYFTVEGGDEPQPKMNETPIGETAEPEPRPRRGGKFVKRKAHDEDEE